MTKLVNLFCIELPQAIEPCKLVILLSAETLYTPNLLPQSTFSPELKMLLPVGNSTISSCHCPALCTELLDYSVMFIDHSNGIIPKFVYICLLACLAKLLAAWSRNYIWLLYYIVYMLYIIYHVIFIILQYITLYYYILVTSIAFKWYSTYLLMNGTAN